MKKLTQIVTTAFLALSLGFSPVACLKKHEFNIREAEELVTGTEIALKGNVKYPLRETADREKEYLEIGLKREFYGFTSNGEVYIELMIFKDEEKKIGEKDNYAYVVYWGDQAEEQFENFRKDKKYKIEDVNLEVSADLKEFKEGLERIDSLSHWFFCSKGRGRRLTLTFFREDRLTPFRDYKSSDDMLYFGLRLRNLETGKSEDLVYAVKVGIGKNDFEFKGYSNGIINYQDTDNDPIPSLIVKSEDENGGRK